MTHDSFSRLLRQVASLPKTGPVLGPGDRVGRFEIVREIGHGGFGVVYQARDTDLGRHVAIKTLRLSDEERERFDDEATTAARLNHPNIVTLHDHGVHEGMPYLVLELLEGMTLRQRIEDGAMPPSQIRDLGVQLARALVHAHATGVIHRDLKPENVFLRTDGVVKLLDFGVSWARPSIAADTSGTRGYMAPEQTRGEPHDARADVFALGVVLYESATGERPADPPDLTALPAALVPAIGRALCASASARPTAQAILDLLVERVHADRAQPYRWLEAFREDDAAWFFGRDPEIARLHLMVGARPVVVLAGVSGAGKSSLVRAGLVPRLVEEQWRIVALRAGERSVDELIGRLGDAGDWHEHPGRFADRVRRALGGSRMLVFVDQAEQLVALPATDREHFLAALLACADDPEGPVRLLLAVRDDFLIELVQTTGLQGELGRSLLLLGAPDPEHMRAALIEPARRLDVELEPGLVDDIVGALQVVRHDDTTSAAPDRVPARRDDVDAGTTPLPLLQLAASRLWELRDVTARTIPRSALAKLGGMTGLLAHHAAEVLHGLAPGQRPLARTILTSLITPERMRRSVERERLIGPPGAARVLDHLIQGRLVTGGEQVELAHESLIIGWAELQSWLDDDVQRITLRERIAAASLHWTERGRPRELLWRGTPLIDALAIVGELSGRDRDFITAGRARARGRRRLGLGIVAATTLAALAAGVLAVRASQIATRERAAARIQTIVHRAELADDPVVAALLFAELGETEPPGGTAAALRVGATPVPIAVLRGHTVPIRSTAISHDGKLVATCGTDACRIWPIDGRGSPRVLPRGFVCRFTADDSELVIATSVGENKTSSRILRISLRRSSTTTLDVPGVLNAMLVLPDGRIVTGHRDGAVRVWDGDRATLIAQHRRPVQRLLPLPDGRIVTTARGDSRALVSGTTVLDHDEKTVESAAVLADGRIITHAGNTLRVWLTDGGPPTILARDAADELDLPQTNGMPLVLPEGRVAYLDVHGRVVLASLAGEPAIVADHHPGGIRKLRAAANGVVVAATYEGRAIVMFRDRAITELRGHRGAIDDMAVAPDGRIVVTAGLDGVARVWRLDEAPAMKLVPGHAGEVTDVRFSPDGERVLSVSRDRSARIWDVARTAQRQVLQQPSDALCGDWGTDNRFMVASYEAVRIYDDGRLRNDIRLPPQPDPTGINCAAISADGRLVAAATSYGVLVFDLATGRVRDTGHFKPDWPIGRPFGYEHVAFSPDGRWLVAAARCDQVYLWPADDSAAPSVIHTNADANLSPISNHAFRALFLPDGQRIVTADYSGAIRLWSRDGREDLVRARQGGPFVRPTRDGRRIAVVGGIAAEVQTIDPGGERLVLATQNQVPTRAADVSPDGRRAVTADEAGMLRFWWITWRDLHVRMRDSTSTCLTVEQRRELLDETPGAARERFTACERRNGRPGAG